MWHSERRGSGVIVGGNRSGSWFVLTNAHVVEAMIADARTVPRVYIDGEWITGRVLGVDRQADLALVLIKSRERLRILRLATASPAGGSSVVTRAFAGGTKWTTRKTTIHPSMKLKDGKYASAPHTHFVDSTFHQGESGGAIVSGGRLVGLIYGNDLGNGWGLCVDHASISSFLARWGWKPGMYSGRDLRSIAQN